MDTTANKYAVIAYEDGNVDIMPVWEDGLTDAELVEAATAQGLERDECAFTVRVHTIE